VLPGVTRMAHEEDGGSRGVLREQHRLGEVTYLMALQVPGATGFVLGAPAERASIEGRWGSVLLTAVREGSPISRLQVLLRTAPSSDNGHASWLAEVADPRSPFYEPVWKDALRQSAPADHEAFLLVQIALSRCRTARQRGGGDADRGAMAVLSDEVERILAEVREIAPGTRVLTARGLAGVLRNAYDPDARRQRCADAEWETVSPTFERETVGWYQSQQHYHATLAVRAWPRTSVRSGFALPLLLWSKAAHAFSVVYEPVPPGKALRQAEQAVTDEVAEGLTRARWGFRDKTRRHLERRGVARREEELAGGHQEYRFAGYLTVSVRAGECVAESLTRLDAAVAEARDRARSSGGIDLQLLAAEQAAGFSFTLPLARGL
ncbi:MAG: SCO6880 family protein, partial [Candidatus Dormibacteria bacterium]